MLSRDQEIFDKIISRYKNANLSTRRIEKAYEVAKDLHANQTRNDGTPYIIHPVEVAYILSEFDFDEDVICAALLHDTVEDCGYSLKQIEIDFNKNVANLVDSVSAIDETTYTYNQDNLFEDPEFVKSSMEDQTFKKLIALGKKNPCGFCIKFADRLHNLRTIESFNYSKQLEKVRETEKWILPIAKKLGAEFFFRAIQNECFRVVNRQQGEQYFASYKFYHKTNRRNLEKMSQYLQSSFSTNFVKQILIHDVLEYKVFDDLKELSKNINIEKVTQGQLIRVTNYNMYLIYDNSNYKNVLKDVLLGIDKKLAGLVKVLDAKIGRFTQKPYFVLEDDLQNKYNLYIMTKNEYRICQIGTLDGQVEIDENDEEELGSDWIRVKTRSGERKYMPKDATVLDFAFKLHEDLGFGFDYAVINKSKTKFPPYTKLNDGDQVEIMVVRDSNGEIKNKAQIKWLAYANTEQAKRKLIKYFEKMLKINRK